MHTHRDSNVHVRIIRDCKESLMRRLKLQSPRGQGRGKSEDRLRC